MTALVDISAELSARVEELDFPSVPFVYNPLVYARVPHEAYLERWGSKAPREVLHGRHEPRAVRHGADGRSVRRRHDGARLPRDHGTGRTTRSRASAAADLGLRLHALGGERHPALGLGARSLLDAPIGSSIGPSSRTGARSSSWTNPDGTALRTSSRPESVLRSSASATRHSRGSSTCSSRGSSSASAASPNDGRRRLSGTGLASGASRTRAPRAPPRTAAGPKPSTRGFASSGSSRAR